MGKITPEEHVQQVREFLLEDLDFDPPQVQTFFTSNIFGRAFAHLVGWTGRKAKMLKCTSAGELKTAPTTTGIEHAQRFKGFAEDIWSVALSFDETAARVDFFIWDNPGNFRLYLGGVLILDDVEAPAGFYSIDCRVDFFCIKNQTEGQVARYQVIGWW